jgi:hypothetical protein
MIQGRGGRVQEVEVSTTAASPSILEYAAGELGSNRQKGGLDFTVTQRRTSAEEDSGDWEEALRDPS